MPCGCEAAPPEDTADPQVQTFEIDSQHAHPWRSESSQVFEQPGLGGGVELLR